MSPLTWITSSRFKPYHRHASGCKLQPLIAAPTAVSARPIATPGMRRLLDAINIKTANAARPCHREVSSSTPPPATSLPLATEYHPLLHHRTRRDDEPGRCQHADNKKLPERKTVSCAAENQSTTNSSFPRFTCAPTAFSTTAFASPPPSNLKAKEEGHRDQSPNSPLLIACPKPTFCAHRTRADNPLPARPKMK